MLFAGSAAIQSTATPITAGAKPGRDSREVLEPSDEAAAASASGGVNFTTLRPLLLRPAVQDAPMTQVWRLEFSLLSSRGHVCVLPPLLSGVSARPARIILASPSMLN